ncbi:caffeoyl-CoA O-methyltransferase [Nocardioides scoriae]|uniref:Caffeoyl-CoA O-methyltransferase n=1 Tax=Nocardioides scoriae TaxID=642780 RepID=A0A1H1V577_9ACTN|nr:class I SAM-dependent methyltransferase [Nocardioides scoriae]SDS79651.1 caffeoyl-CoA O-methyltransferase [Nocardioides scoriae]
MTTQTTGPTARTDPPPPGPRPVTPVAILADSLARIASRLGELEGVDPDLGSEIRRAAELAGGLDDYTARLSTPESPALRALAERTAAEDWEAHTGTALEQEMLSGHVEGQTLKMLVHATRATRVLEIGMFTGYSALAMAEALPDEGVVVACEIDPRVAEIAQECFDATPDGDKIDVHVGPAIDTLHALADAGAHFDLVFIDADKAGYVDYFHALLDSRLLAPRALVAVDNTLMQGLPWRSDDTTANGEAIARFNQVVADDPCVEQVVLPVRDGITLIRRVRA